MHNYVFTNKISALTKDIEVLVDVSKKLLETGLSIVEADMVNKSIVICQQSLHSIDLVMSGKMNSTDEEFTEFLDQNHDYVIRLISGYSDLIEKIAEEKRAEG